ncbi:MAG: ATP-dependent Clp protease proteolytic subunit [Chitinophagales bacterium]|nr:ATP-dependent Clp protease proteolytic subunit [Chitinophagales bacterium]
MNLDYLWNNWRNDDSDDKEKEKEEKDNLSKKAEELFLKQRRIFFWGPVDDKSMEKILNKVLLLDGLDSGKPIDIFLSSPGGSVTSGLALMDTMRAIESPVNTTCIGLAASMGAMILSHGTKGKRRAYKNARVMIHQPSIGGIRGQAIDLEITAKQINKSKLVLAEILAENCNQPLDKILKDFDRDYWMDAQEALQYGIIDEIVEKL